ncbi:MAG: protein kinase [Acidobacteria bacterium]|nr:protein kinase [Acidobacteriota bacterium]
MNVSSGSRLGPYEIVSRIGAGGMGEVWRARDTRLERDVAVKILPTEFAANAQLKLRFEREAKTISQLNHPHICVLHDVGETRVERGEARGEGEQQLASHLSPLVSYLVMELIDGESLADRLGRGPLPLAEVLKYGAQIADALDRAHRHGVVHRDLKPGNVMLTRSGAKLLDFGLAKTATIFSAGGLQRKSSAEPQRDVQDQSTAFRPAQPLTQEGTILGTFQYMAPEQLEGEESDPRTDIFALGAVLYEMLTGTRAFEGKTKTSLIAAIVGSEPRPARTLQPLTPSALEHLIERCLRKDRDDRWQSARDIAEQLRWIGSSSEVQPQSGRRSPVRLAVVAAVVIVLLSAALGAALWKLRDSRMPSLRLGIPLAEGTVLGQSMLPNIAVSPDGGILAYTASTGGGPAMMHLRALDQFEGRVVPGSEHADTPFFSPDGKWVGFVAGGELRKVAVDGGAVARIATVRGSPTGAVWLEDDTIVFAPHYNSGLSRVSASGGRIETLTTLDLSAKESSHGWPDVLPDGETIIFTIERSGQLFDRAVIGAVSLRDGTRSTILEGGSRASYVAGGYLLFARSSSLFGVAFDPKRKKVTGTPVELVNGVLMNQGRGTSHYSISRSGLLAFVPGGEVVRRNRLLWTDLNGNVTSSVEQPGSYNLFRISPDGQKVAVQVVSSNDDLWLLDLERGTQVRLTFEGENYNPVWTPDGKWIIFASDRAGQFNLYRMRTDGSGIVERLTESTREQVPTSVSTDGTVVFTEFADSGGSDLWTLSLEDRDRKPAPLVATPFEERSASFSPGGKWLAYSSDESGRREIYLRPLEGDAKILISIDGGDDPVWSPRGDELFYRSGEQMFGVRMPSGPEGRSERPRRLFEHIHGLGESRWGRYFDVAPDGERFLLLLYEEEQMQDRIHLSAGFDSDIREKAK